MDVLELPSPADLGFADKFGEWRPEQLEGITRTIESGTRFIGLSMPTGSGKSLTKVASALLHPDVRRSAFLTSTKGLQDQDKGDFESVGLVDVRGQRNYPCIALQPGGQYDFLARTPHHYHGCDDGPCRAGSKCTHLPSREERNNGAEPSCLYYRALWQAQQAEFTSTNYAMWFATRSTRALGLYDMLFLDEAHEAAKELENHLTFTVTRIDAQLLGSKIPDSDDLRDWQKWASAFLPVVTQRIDDFPRPVSHHEDIKELQKLEQLSDRLTMLKELSPDDWLMERDEKDTRIMFAPIRVADYAEKYLFRGVKRVVLCSATLTHKTFNMLGIEKDDYTLWECPSRFPASRRPVIHVAAHPGIWVDARHSGELHHAAWRMRIDAIIRPRMALGRKGIIHTVSYRRMKYLLQTSEYRKLMIAHDTEHTRLAVEKFKQSKEPSILVSPSVTTGWDFPDAMCRYQIIGKVPFPDTRGVVASMRHSMDKEYGPYLASQMLVQAAGRGMRSAEDWCETLIVDNNIEWFWKKFKHLFPAWFIQAFQVARVLPPPLQVFDDDDED
jgi:Rad3-related DNA helicase